jgi:hypothetical protein
MQLFHFDRAPNYGDALNPWLWPRLLGSRLQGASPTLFLGIGTLLKTDLPPAEAYVVLGTGGGYGPFPRLDPRWRVYAVRGPLSARALGLDPGQAATDGAYLLRTVELPPPRFAGPRIAFMPHWQTRLRVGWESICARAGLHYLDPRRPVDEILAELQGCEGVIAEAMHAAITADALRIRWLPVRLGAHFLDFKWRDWCGAMRLDCDAHALPTVHALLPTRAEEGPLRRSGRRAVNAAGYVWQGCQLATRLRELRLNFERDAAFGHLSSPLVMINRLGRLERGLDRLRQAET